MTNYTHKYEMQLGIDLTKILSPENIPGIKAYLGVKNDNDLMEAVVRDQYLKIENAMNKLGIGIINARFTGFNANNGDEKESDNDSKAETEVKEEPKKESVNDKNKTIDDDTPKFESVNEQIANCIKKLTKNDDVKEISTVTINAKFINYVEGSEALHKASGLNEDTEITFDELDEGMLMIVSYINGKGSLKHSKIEFKKNMTRQEDK